MGSGLYIYISVDVDIRPCKRRREIEVKSDIKPRQENEYPMDRRPSCSLTWP